jgi:mono/diheme cytochrome c family protein
MRLSASTSYIGIRPNSFCEEHMKHLHQHAATLVATAGFLMSALAGNGMVKTVQASQPGLQTSSNLQSNEPTVSMSSTQTLYEENCLACHGSDGKGSMTGVPDLTDTNGPMAQSDEFLKIRIVNGFTSPGRPWRCLQREEIPALQNKTFSL